MTTPNGFSFLVVIENIAKETNSMANLATAVAYLLGIVFFVSGIMMAKRSADPAARADHGKMAWAWSFAFSALMLALPTTIASVGATMFGSSTPTDLTFAYISQPQKKLAPLVPILKLIGVIAVIRGLMVLRKYSIQGERGNVTFGRGLTLVIAGVLLVHMKSVLGMLSSLTGLNLGASLF
jgi:hypothetical protein